MGLPRGRRWEDRPIRANPSAALRAQAVLEVINGDTPPIDEPLALREQVHREALAAERRQGELALRGTHP